MHIRRHDKTPNTNVIYRLLIYSHTNSLLLLMQNTHTHTKNIIY